MKPFLLLLAAKPGTGNDGVCRSFPNIGKKREAFGVTKRHRSMINPVEQQPERPTEDDIAKAKLGPLGVPGGKDKPARDPDELQISPDNDPGHTA